MTSQKLIGRLGEFDIVGIGNPVTDTCGLLILASLEEVHDRFESKMRLSDGRINRVHKESYPSPRSHYFYQVLDTAVRLSEVNFENPDHPHDMIELRIFHHDALKRDETLNYLKSIL